MVLLPHRSVTFQTRVATNVGTQVKLVVVLTMLRTKSEGAVQLSETMGTVKPQPKPHWSTSFCPQLIVGGTLSTTVTVWLHVADWPQLSTPFQVRVMICGQTPLVMSLTTEMVTPPLGRAALGQQGLTGVGGSKFHGASQLTVLGGAHCRENGPVVGPTTWNCTEHGKTAPFTCTVTM